ncbi:MAG: SBBP repeat-containing protein [Candidatus Eisenbacteria bacterium]
MRTVFSALLVLVSGPAIGFAEAEQEWVARHSSPGNFNDVAYAMTIDAFENVYVTGTASNDFGSDCVTIKYDAAGAVQWVRTFDGGTHDVGFAIAVDDLGNVYIAGSTQSFGDDYLTIKYDSSGTEQWVRTYEGPVFESDSAASIAVDSDGNVYVTGYSTGDGTGLDYATIKYSPGGDELWLRRFDVGAGEDVAAMVAVTSSGIVVTGRSNYDYTTIMYSPDGVEQWQRTYDGPGNSADTAVAVKLDEDDNIFVTGLSIAAGNDYDYATIKYDPAGTELWVRRFDESDFDYASALAIDPQGNVFVTGASADDFATVKYDPTGTELWVRRFGAAQTGDSPYAIAVDAQGNSYVTGYSYGDSVTTYDYATVAYDASGEALWTQSYNGPGNFYDIPHSIAVHESGDVFVTGQSGGDGTALDYATIKYSQTTAGVAGPGPAPGDVSAVAAFALRNDPNPFRSSTMIRFTLPPGPPQPVRLSVFDVGGQEVAILANGTLAAGDYQWQLDGSKLSSGVYYSRLQAGDLSQTRKILLVE